MAVATTATSTMASLSQEYGRPAPARQQWCTQNGSRPLVCTTSPPEHAALPGAPVRAGQRLLARLDRVPGRGLAGTAGDGCGPDVAHRPFAGLGFHDS